MKRSDITPEFVRQLMSYDKKTGKLFWKPRSASLFPSERTCKIWNARYAHTEAFTTLQNGYHGGSLCNMKFSAHRVAWAIHHGEWPTGTIDHINHCASDNRMKNLRDVTQAENNRNVPLRPTNTSGHNGVSWHIRQKKWQVYIKVDGKRMGLGSFSCKKTAVATRKAADEKYGFHRNHGKR